MTVARTAASVVAKTVGSVVGSRGGGATASLDIKARVGTSTSPTTTGTRAVTGVGFTRRWFCRFGTIRQQMGQRLKACLVLVQ